MPLVSVLYMELRLQGVKGEIVGSFALETILEMKRQIKLQLAQYFTNYSRFIKQNLQIRNEIQN